MHFRPYTAYLPPSPSPCSPWWPPSPRPPRLSTPTAASRLITEPPSTLTSPSLLPTLLPPSTLAYTPTLATVYLLFQPSTPVLTPITASLLTQSPLSTLPAPSTHTSTPIPATQFIPPATSTLASPTSLSSQRQLPNILWAPTMCWPVVTNIVSSHYMDYKCPCQDNSYTQRAYNHNTLLPKAAFQSISFLFDIVAPTPFPPPCFGHQ